MGSSLPFALLSPFILAGGLEHSTKLSTALDQGHSEHLTVLLKTMARLHVKLGYVAQAICFEMKDEGWLQCNFCILRTGFANIPFRAAVLRHYVRHGYSFHAASARLGPNLAHASRRDERCHNWRETCCGFECGASRRDSDEEGRQWLNDQGWTRAFECD